MSRSISFIGSISMPNVDDIRHEEAQVFDEEVMRNEGVLAKLNFDRYAILHEIGFVPRLDGNVSSGLNRRLLIFRREMGHAAH